MVRDRMTETIICIEYEYFNGRGNWDRELLKRLAISGYNVHAICCPFPDTLKDEENTLREAGVNIHYIRKNKIWFPIGSAIQVFSILRNNKGSIYTPSIRLIPIYSPICKIFEAPIIFSLQGAPLKELSIMPEFEKIRSNKLLYFIKRNVVMIEEKISANCADEIIVISKEIEDELNTIGVPENKVNLIYYAIDTDRFRFNKTARMNIRNKYEIKDSDIVIAYVARLLKKVPTRLWSAKTLLRVVKDINRQNIIVLFVGGGDGTDELKSLVDEYGLKEQVVFAGFQPHESIPNFLSASDYFWFVMKDPLPTYGLALQEAMSCGCVVITNNSGSMKEIIKDGLDGYLVEPNDESINERVSQIIRQDNIKQISKLAVQKVKSKYSWEVIMPKIQRVIANVTGQEYK